MKLKIAAVLFFILSFSLTSSAVKVSTEELKNIRKVEFINYTGKPKKVDSFQEIRSIGQGLARQSKSVSVHYLLKYSVIHAISKTETEKLDADIFSIDKNARTNHIRDVRFILSSYLQARYKYSEKDAKLLAVFLSYYNAVYRGNLKYFSEKYKKTVLKYINEENAGIAVKYSDWPGQTKMLIPLTFDELKGNVSSLDPNELSDKKVIESLKNEKDKGVAERKQMIEIRERDLEKKKESIEDRKEAIKEKKEELAVKKEKLEEKKKEIESKKKESEKTEKEIKKEEEKLKTIDNPSEKAKKEKELEQKKKEIEQDKKKIEKEEKKVQTEEKKISKEDENLKKEESKVGEKEKEIAKQGNEISEEKKEIKKDEREILIQKQPAGEAKKELEKQKEELIQKEKELDKREEQLKQQQAEKNLFAGKIYYLKIQEYTSDGHYNNDLLMINAADKKIEFKSPLTNICGRKYDVFKEGVVVIAHQGQHKSAHNLVLVDKDKLEVIVRGNDNIFWRSFVEVRDDFIYAITLEKEGYCLGKFNKDLVKVGRSKVQIHEDSFITFFGDLIYINGVDKKIVILNKSDLSQVGEIMP